jgi:serine/threonine protein kinase
MASDDPSSRPVPDAADEVSGGHSPEPPRTVEEFLRAVLRSRVVSRDALLEALRDMPREQRGDMQAVSQHLVKKGKLSRFQASKIRKGAGRGLLMGPYQILAPIGRGGMGTVYMARDERSSELVALKVLPPNRARGEERLLARFQREMEISRRVAHPHLAWTYETGQRHGVHYIAMEYIPGKNLSRLISEEGPLRLPRAARLMAEVAAGLEHAHNQGLVHRDLKPSNIVITPNDHAKVLDLGLALVTGEQGSEVVVGGHNYIVGTMDYIAPEQTVDAAHVDCRSDIYSLGCTLYFALTGRPPFPGGSSRDKVRRHRGDEPESLLILQPSLPAGFVRVVEKMMAKNPDDRYPSAAAVEEELRNWASGETVLPLDRREDAPYAEALAVLREVEPSGDYSLPEGPDSLPGEDSSGGQRRRSSSSIALPPLSEEPAAPWPPWALTLLLALGLSLTLLVLLILLFGWLVGP